MKNIIDKLKISRTLSPPEFKALLTCNEKDFEYLIMQARETQQAIFSKKIFMRGLIEFTNYCRQDCYYCGIRCSNKQVERYRLNDDTIIGCCTTAYKFGFRTFVLQGGEDAYYTTDKICSLIINIRTLYPDCAITLSIGQRDEADYISFKKAGADRYLLREETASPNHYKTLHPTHMSLDSRLNCLHNLKSAGFQVGCGFLIGSPNQTLDNIVEDLLFIELLNPAMVGVGPFIPHSNTPFSNEPAGDLMMSLRIIAILRLMNPHLLIPATTALETLGTTNSCLQKYTTHSENLITSQSAKELHSDPRITHARSLGILAGANVVMLNVTPQNFKDKYLLYNNKAGIKDANVTQSLNNLAQELNQIGYEISISRGDYNG